MATLTQTAYQARRAIKYGGIGFVAIIILWFAGTSAISWWKILNPPPAPAPTVDFNQLPPITFPKSSATITKFDLQTPTGKLGDFPDRLLVYFAPTKKSSFLDADRAITLAKRLGFLTTPDKSDATLYRWSTTSPLPTTLQMNITSNHFLLKRQWQADPTLISLKLFASDQQAIRDAQNFLNSAGLLSSDLRGNEKVTYLKAQGDQLIPATSLSESDFVQVDFFRLPVEIENDQKEVVATYDFYTADPDIGLASIIVSGSQDKEKKIVQVDYRYVTIDYLTTGEYPLKTVDQAWQELVSGGGYIAAAPSSTTATVRRVNLGYYDSSSPQEYAMPIYVFTGDDGFTAYVSAVSSDWIQAAQ